MTLESTRSVCGNHRFVKSSPVLSLSTHCHHNGKRKTENEDKADIDEEQD